jgi:hypothetical protein
MGTPVTYTWLPSTARVILLDGFGVVPRGTLQLPPVPLQWPAKDPSDVLDYVVDVSEVIAGNEGDAVSTLDVTISPNNPGDLILQSSSADGDQVILWLSGGFAGTTYAVTVLVGTNSGRNFARTINLPVVNLTVPVVLPNDIVDEDGAPIIDQAGDPITTS